jgi:hypothetical protein
MKPHISVTLALMAAMIATPAMAAPARKAAAVGKAAQTSQTEGETPRRGGVARKAGWLGNGGTVVFIAAGLAVIGGLVAIASNNASPASP